MMTTPLEEFLSKDGSVELLCAIGQGERFTELNEELPISEGTLSKRLGRAIELDLIKQEVNPEGRGKLNKFTHKGALLWHRMKVLGLIENYEDYIRHLNRFRDKSDELIEHIAENPDELEDTNIGVDELYQAVHLDSNPLKSDDDLPVYDRDDDD